MFPKVAQMVETTLLTYNDPFLSSPKSQEYFWATFVTKCVTINFQKSPNLVTLGATYHVGIVQNTIRVRPKLDVNKEFVESLN